MFNLDDFKDQTIIVNVDEDAALVSPAESEGLVKDIMQACNLERHEAVIALAIICQKGGTSKKAQGTIYAIINGKKLDLAAIRKVMSEKKYKFTLRQWARTHGTFIYQVGNQYGINGDLAKKVGRDHPELNLEELIWMSNFQMDNPDCPKNVRALLKAHFRSLFPGKFMGD